MRRRELEEYLETLWHLAENKESDINNFRAHIRGEFNEGITRTLEMEGYIEANRDMLMLTPEGERQAREIVRRHRLAERLLRDVLGMEAEDAETGACEFEHLLAPEITESICTLLGHPRQCPHGYPIPEGKCCTDGKETTSSAVMPLTKSKVGESYRVAYVNTSSDSRMHKLMHFGVGPGALLRLHQSYPTYVIHGENGQLAMEKDVAADIYVWINGGLSKKRP